MPVQRKIGKVIEKTGANVVTVQFQDGTRKRLITDTTVILAKGDIGFMDVKGQKIIGFKSADNM